MVSSACYKKLEEMFVCLVSLGFYCLLFNFINFFLFWLERGEVWKEGSRNVVFTFMWKTTIAISLFLKIALVFPAERHCIRFSYYYLNLTFIQKESHTT